MVVATYVSVWDGGTELVSRAEVNEETGEVTILDSFEGNDVDILVNEYIIIGLVTHKVCHKDALEEHGGDIRYWYE